MADVTTQPRATTTRKPATPAPLATPPEPTGYPLASIPRGRNEELRVTLDTFSGHEYVGLRVWAQNRAGDWWPVGGKGCSIRVAELGGVIQALELAADMLDDNAIED